MIYVDLDLDYSDNKAGAVKRWLDMEDDVNSLPIFDNAGIILAEGFLPPIQRNTHDINVAEPKRC